MTRATYGMMLGMIGSAIGFWIWNRQLPTPTRPSRGTVIFRNTPTAAGNF